MDATITQLYEAVGRIKSDTFKGIGRPLIQVPLEKVSVVFLDGEPALFMEMDDVIKLATSILSQ